MNSQLWSQVRTKYQLGKLIYGKVEFHAPFGVFVDIGDKDVKGILKRSPLSRQKSIKVKIKSCADKRQAK